MGGKDAGDIAAEPEEGCVAEGQQPAEPERQIEADGGKRQDDDAGRERHIEGFAHAGGQNRCAEKQKGKQQVDGGFAAHLDLTTVPQTGRSA
ncbi:hypothetical protein D9M72_521610 [compost metagenome]